MHRITLEISTQALVSNRALLYVVGQAITFVLKSTKFMLFQQHVDSLSQCSGFVYLSWILISKAKYSLYCEKVKKLKFEKHKSNFCIFLPRLIIECSRGNRTRSWNWRFAIKSFTTADHTLIASTILVTATKIALVLLHNKS